MTTKRLQAPGLDLSKIVGIVGIANGGTNADTAPVAVDNLGGLRRSTAGQANKPVPIGSNGKIDISFFDAVSGNYVSLSGPSEVLANEVAIFEITNFDSWKTYTVSTVSGNISRVGNKIHYTAPSSGVTCGFIINGRIIDLDIVTPLPAIVTPNIIAPSNNSINISTTPSFSSNSYVGVNGVGTHYSSDWQISDVIDFSNIVESVTNSTTDKLAWNANQTPLASATMFYARVRYRSSDGIISNWSPVINFTTI